MLFYSFFFFFVLAATCLTEGFNIGDVVGLSIYGFKLGKILGKVASEVVVEVVSEWLGKMEIGNGPGVTKGRRCGENDAEINSLARNTCSSSACADTMDSFIR